MIDVCTLVCGSRATERGSNLAVMGLGGLRASDPLIFCEGVFVGRRRGKVTQASRDGGVDAVAFDPDPIRGGKIVIQAKRYAYTVGVSARRDLYGTA